MNLIISGGNLGHLHLYIPVTVLIITNIVFFALAVRYFLRIKNDLRRITASDTASHKRMLKANKRK